MTPPGSRLLAGQAGTRGAVPACLVCSRRRSSNRLVPLQQLTMDENFLHIIAHKSYHYRSRYSSIIKYAQTTPHHACYRNEAPFIIIACSYVTMLLALSI